MRRHATPGRPGGIGTPTTPGVPGTPAGSLVFDSTLNIVFDGNSLIYGQGGAQNIPRCVAKIAPIATSTAVGFLPDANPLAGSPTNKWQSNKGVIVRNLGVNGQTWRQMSGLDGGSVIDVDGAFDTTAGRQNVLGGWEWTNAATLAHRTFAQLIQDATDWALARRAAHPWTKVFTGTALPRMNSATDQSIVDADNALLDQVNAYLLANYQSMGFDAVFDVRKAGTYFDMQGDYSIAHFNAMAAASDTFWAPSGSDGSQHIHLNSNGYWYIATQFIVPMLQSL
jgi:hypothetical protein